jgi:hypothetical protein
MAGFDDGTLLAAKDLTLTAERLRITLPSGEVLSSDDPRRLVFVQPLGQAALYLSDLKPHSYKQVPFLNLAWPYRLDQNVLGERLRAGGKLYEKGIGMHSASRLTFQLDGAYARFAAELALDDAAGRKGSAVFRVYTNSGEKWQQAFASETIRGGDAPVPMSIDITGAKALTLIIDYADRGDELDHADWLNARLLK